MRHARVVIAFGSQTGNAEDCAETIRRFCLRQRLDSRLVSLDDLDMDLIEHANLIIFVCSTTGQGEMPDNMRAFWRWLLQRDMPHVFEHSAIAVFGLGDSAYPRFNHASRKLEKRILQLGGNPLLPRGEGDDQHELGVEGTLTVWLELLKEKLDTFDPLPPDEAPLPSGSILPSEHRIHFVDQTVTASTPEEHGTVTGVVAQNTRITHPRHWQDVRHVVFSVPGVSFEPGDIAVVHPENSDEDALTFLRLMEWCDKADLPLRVERVFGCGVDTAHLSAKVTTLRTLAKSYFDLRCVPRRSVFEYLAHFTPSQLHAERLAELASAGGIDDYFDYVTRPRRTLLEVLEEFSSVKIPLDFIFDVLPRLRGRQFSIANSLRWHPNEIHLCVALVRYQTVLKRPREGVCSRWLRHLPVGWETRLQIIRGAMRQPLDSTAPTVLVGVGTGIAPMRAILQDRILCRDKGQEEASTVLFHGNRNRSHDYLFGSELDELAKRGLLHVFLAFSRDQPQKYYVQNALTDHGDVVFRWLYERKGYMLVSGSSGKMPLAVRAAVARVIESHGGLTAAEAEAYVHEMERSGRYRQETW